VTLGSVGGGKEEEWSKDGKGDRRPKTEKGKTGQNVGVTLKGGEGCTINILLCREKEAVERAEP